MKTRLLFSASAVGLFYILAASLPLAAMPPAAEKETSGPQDLKELEAKISLNATVENQQIKIPETSEIKQQVDSVQADKTISTTNQNATLPQETANLNPP
ncbi:MULTISPECIES: hypothetical protein [unclassified Microcoleus]|uniref:hypothetical protein n=1 Tax=unclassified Microcoleus TaxID=2642155 RepID=UPI0025D03E8A|nr:MULTISPECIES: hypothetical protein [unclassified Microcoleus]